MKNKSLWRQKAPLIELKSRPLRVVIIGDSFIPMVDGVVRVMENYIEQFQNKGIEFLVLAPAYSDYDLKKDLELDYKPMRIKCSLIKWGGYQVIRTPLVKSELLDIDKFNPDIVHVHSPFFAGNIGLQLKKRYNIPLIITMHTNFKMAISKSANSAIIGQIGGLVVQQFIKNTDGIFHVSRSSMIESGLDLTQNKHFIVPNGTKFKFPYNHEFLKHQAIEKYNIDSNKFNLLFVSRFVWEKNIKLMLDSYKKLIQINPKYHLTMVGGDWKYDEVVEYAKSIGVYEHINFTGIVRDCDLLKGLYLSHDLLLFPSVFDTFGLVIHEAASQGLPSLVIKNSAAAESIVDGFNGFTCMENIDSLVENIIHIFSEPEKLKIVGEASKTMVYDWSKIIDKSLKNYIDIIKNFYDSARLKRFEKLSVKIRNKFKK
ncbi:glycosyltransferase [Mycoplasma sp. ES3157-GEN-MYC]|uniref:Glycosyltransferase n=1 Tax=Mycoplasma miroungigenitalium TaxID=754515 RepID=A0A6M4J9K4_9MOLU|nr:glycosyltransferase [Mycoplasma miroungigenitalium]MBU4690556.1 glycosyltransferase [Mycoplasma miroungigenitalium]MBU4691823.1 glycosyltransferase [Mycoplasma miroungigenitalium]QJR43684.1 glycosyltransferase [Mycoplasma miroungigenitalium]